MGFGEKTNPTNGKTYNLDKTYDAIIRPAVEKAGYKCVRADEVVQSGAIDKPLYALLIHADLVIADITTLNANAIYELGVRHASKAYHTIIMMSNEDNIPFDINHEYIFKYEHLGKDIGSEEANLKANSLCKLIINIETNTSTNSPVFAYINELTPHSLSKEDFNELINCLSDKAENIYGLTVQAKQLMSNNTKDDFYKASLLWEKAASKVADNIFYIQQQTLCIYKSENPSKAVALDEALKVISDVYNEIETTDPETLGLLGAIYKRKYETNNDIETLKLAIEMYKKGYLISKNHYPGGNYAICLDILFRISNDEDEKIYCKFEAKKIRKEIIVHLGNLLALDEIKDKKWTYATISTCYYFIKDDDNEKKYEELFLNEEPEEWEKETYYTYKKDRNE